MKNKRAKALRSFGLFLTTICSFSVLSCSKNKDSKQELVPGANRELLEGVEYDLSNAVFDDFVNGIDQSLWIIGNGAWGNGNGGVIPENVSYTEDGILILRGNGEYYSENDVRGVGTLKDGKNTGACIISKFNATPGHYEVKMKPLPRKGACTAIWTYANRPSSSGEENENHEIDIELPGGKSNSPICFRDVLNTNYITESYNESQDVDLNVVTQGKVINLIDGNFHTFGFDWYTNPGKVIYFVDGIITAVSDMFTPTLDGKFWIGNWFPNNAGFVGLSKFETDYMLVDYAKFIPFKDQPHEEFEATPSVAAASLSQYPTSPVVIPEVNQVANGDFEYVVRKETQENYGWTFSRLNGVKDEVSNICYAQDGVGVEGSAAAVIKDGGYLYTTTPIDGIYEGDSFTLSFEGKSNTQYSQVIIRFKDSADRLIDGANQSIVLNSADFKQYEKTYTAPEGTYSVELQAYSYNGKVISGAEMVLDNIKIIKG